MVIVHQFVSPSSDLLLNRVISGVIASCNTVVTLPVESTFNAVVDSLHLSLM